MIPGTVVLTLLIDLQRCDTDDTFDTNGSGVNKLSVTMKYFEHLAMTGHNMSSILTHRLDCWYHKKAIWLSSSSNWYESKCLRAQYVRVCGFSFRELYV